MKTVLKLIICIVVYISYSTTYSQTYKSFDFTSLKNIDNVKIDIIRYMTEYERFTKQATSTQIPKLKNESTNPNEHSGYDDIYQWNSESGAFIIATKRVRYKEFTIRYSTIISITSEGIHVDISDVKWNITYHASINGFCAPISQKEVNCENIYTMKDSTYSKMIELLNLHITNVLIPSLKKNL